MSAIDEILFAPIQEWRIKVREIVQYITIVGNSFKPMTQLFDLNRTRPEGSLLLERLMELYHLGGQHKFYYVRGYTRMAKLYTLEIDGRIDFGKYEEGKCPLLGGNHGIPSIRDLNLVPNTYTRHYVFASEKEATTYLGSL